MSVPFRTGVVALVGRPNVGKSTLLNRLVGTKLAIVSDKPQTTRNRIRGVVNRPDGQIVLFDTPGIHRPLHRMNQRMMRASHGALASVDLVAAVTDVNEPFGNGDRYLVELLGQVRVPVFLLVNQIDRIAKPAILPVIEQWSRAFSFTEVYPISARDGDGLEPLLEGLVARLPEGPPAFADDDYTDVTLRFLAGEVVRERVLHHTREELPYSTTVVIESFEEPEQPGKPVRILASIHVERDSQKGIVVGKGGAVIKRIGMEARMELEHILERRVFLGLEVRVSDGWRDDDRLLDRLGLTR